MSLLRTIGDITRGVSEELQADIRDVAWIILDILGLRQLFESLLRELNEADSATSVTSSVRKKRSFIRIIGSAIPLKPVERPYLRYVALRSLSTSYDSLFSSATQNILEGDLRSNHYEKHRTYSHHSTAIAPSTPTFNGFNSDRWVDQSDTFSEDASNKIAALEEELAILRSQIAGIICRAPERPFTPPSTPIPCGAPPPPPPPPPLPPPPLPLSASASPMLPRKSFSEMIAENKDSINNHTDAIDVPTNVRKTSEGVSMVDVLKGLNKVKLKRIDRSPGGTPVRERPRTPPPNDAASLIAAALKKRFAKFQSNSPEKDHDSTSGFSSPEGTPKFSRKSRWDDFSYENSSPAPLEKKPQPFILKKIQNTPPKSKPVKEEKPSLPPFGQHLLKRRTRTPNRGSLSPSSENSDLSR